MLFGSRLRRRGSFGAAAVATALALVSAPAGAQSTSSEPSDQASPPAALEPAPPRPPHVEGRRLPAFLALGIGGLLGGAALTTGIIAKVQYDDAEKSCGRTCSDDQLSSGRTFALTSTVLTGAAIVGVGLGVALLLATPEGETEEASFAPRWDVAIAPQAAAASAAWRF